jgi:hypothetical protein
LILPSSVFFACALAFRFVPSPCCVFPIHLFIAHYYFV